MMRVMTLLDLHQWPVQLVSDPIGRIVTYHSDFARLVAIPIIRKNTYHAKRLTPYDRSDNR